jgi:hypothetical protein
MSQQAITDEQLEVWRLLAIRNQGKESAGIILSLLKEVRTLQAAVAAATAKRELKVDFTDWKEGGVVSDDTPMFFGKHKGLPLVQVPDDYVEWWMGSKNPDEIARDAQGGNKQDQYFAKMKLKLYDYCEERHAKKLKENEKRKAVLPHDQLGSPPSQVGSL